jgi:hypothetical protein
LINQLSNSMPAAADLNHCRQNEVAIDCQSVPNLTHLPEDTAGVMLASGAHRMLILSHWQ